jgi:Ca-activated chloride channel homolog
MKKIMFIIFVLSGVFFVGVGSARADGIIVPDPPICEDGPCFPPDIPIPMDQLVVRYHKVDVTIDGQIAITRVDQIFYNPNDWTIEGTYLFPLPLEAAVTGFTLWIDGKPVEGEVLDAKTARQTYEDIVRRMIDPALLEYAGQGAVRAGVFPIPPGAERRIALEYSQALQAENGLVRYQYPLNTEKFSALPLEEVSVTVDIHESRPIRAVYSPSHPVAIARQDEHHVRAGYEEASVLPNEDFVLYYSLGENEAFHLLTYRDPADPSDPDGFFLLLLAPRPETGERMIPKDVLLVLDQSGSMDGEKFQQAQIAARYILENLNPQDRFNIFTFSTGVDSYATSLLPASEAAAASTWIDQQIAAGGTDINRALLEAAATVDRERPTYLIFLTDGLPTEGVTDVQQILNNLAANAPRNLRLFPFGVGYDVDTILLDTLAQNHHGTSTYVLPGERLDERLSQFYSKISTPVLTDLQLDFGNLAAYDIYPKPLPDLFLGSQIVVVGRYREGGSSQVTLTGMVESRKEVFRFSDQQFSRTLDGNAGEVSAIPRLWATRKIGSLLNQVRLKGADQETIDQIVRLSIRYGIVTPYTSYLVTEDMPLGVEERQRIVSRELETIEGTLAPSFGEDAVRKAATQGDLAEAPAPAEMIEDALGTVRVIGSRTFLWSRGTWIDTAFEPETMETIKVPFLSKSYFELLENQPELRKAFSLGERVIALSEGVAYEVSAPDQTDTDTGSVNPISTPETDPVVFDPGPEKKSVEATPCLGGLLPLFLLPAGLILLKRREAR